ncbi:MAG: class I SAM-dependent methyltransferase [Myxococcales bacterium]|nr:MAG: class I SAM-dependent methyltransferase [Myxococcales bacterium]
MSRFAWRDDPLWAPFYDWTVEHRRLGGLIWRVGMNSDLGLLYDAVAEIGRQPPGSAVLDVPCGGGVALRGLQVGQGIRYVAADISPAMLARTREAAQERGLSSQVETLITDVHDMQFGDAEFDLVVSFTGLHCFPDPHAAVRELARVTAHGGVLTGSALFNDTGWRYEHIRRVGRASGLLGPGCTTDEVQTWLAESGFADITLEVSGAMGYFRAVRP